MAKDKPKSDSLEELRKLAQAKLKNKTVPLRKDMDIAELVTELRTHQVELEMQNEELRKAQAELEESRHKYTDLFDFAPIGYFVLDEEYVINNVNLTGSTLLGIERGRLIKKHFFVYIDEKDRDIFYSHQRQVFTSGTRADCELKIIRHDGTLIYARLISEPVKDGDGSTVQCRMTVTDISERKRSQEAIKEREDELTAIYENAPLIMALVDSEYHIRKTNKFAEQFAGASAASPLGQRFGEVLRCLHSLNKTQGCGFMPDCQECIVRKSIFDTLTTGQSHHQVEASLPVVVEGKPQDFTFLLYTSKLDVSGQPQVLVTIEDITDRKQAEEKLRAVTEELKRSNTDLREFAHVAGHDLKEPLRAINGFMELLSQRYGDKLDEKAMEYINFAANGAKRMNTMLEGLLEYSRVQTRAKPLALTAGHEAFNAAVTNLRASITDADATITCDPLPPVKADTTQLVQLFQNLIGNAVKFRGEERPEIHVGCDKQDNYWLFSVRDNGIGIAPEQHERIFFIFQQLNPTEKYSGYGIGLAICKKIVERHGGKIWVESKPGKGTTIYFTIPN